MGLFEGTFFLKLQFLCQFIAPIYALIRPIVDGLANACRIGCDTPQKMPVTFC